MHDSLPVEIRRKLTRVDFLRPSFGFCGIKLRISRLDGKHLFPLNHLTTSFEFKFLLHLFIVEVTESTSYLTTWVSQQSQWAPHLHLQGRPTGPRTL